MRTHGPVALADVADLDPAFMPTQDKAAALLVMREALTAATALQAKLLAAAGDVAFDTGARDAAACLVGEGHDDLHTVRRVLHLGRALESVSLVSAARSAGRFGIDKARIILRALDGLPDEMTVELRERAEATLVDGDVARADQLAGEATWKPGPPRTPQIEASRVPTSTNPSRMRRCSCHAGPVIDEEHATTVRFAYDTVADTYADHFRATEPEQPADLAAIERFVSLLPHQAQVLDAGCGAGRMLPVLAALGCTVEGIDISPRMVHRAQTDHPSFRSQIASLDALPFDDDRFDGLFYWYSTIHSPDADLPCVLAEASRVLRPGGVILVAFQTGAGVRDVSENYRRHGHNIRLQRFLRNADEVSSLLAAASFSEVSRLDRHAVGRERDGQAVLIARA